MVAVNAHEFLHHDRIGLIGHDRAGKYPDAFARAQLAQERLAGPGNTRQTQMEGLPYVDVPAAEGIAVDRGVSVARNVERRAHRVGQYASERVLQRHSVAAGNRLYRGRDPRARGLDRKQGLAAARIGHLNSR